MTDNTKRIMTEKEKGVILDFVNKMDELDEKNFYWFLGYAEGLLAGKTATVTQITQDPPRHEKSATARPGA